MSKLKKEKPKGGKLQRISDFFKAVITFLGKTYIWSGLLAGFLWSSLTPFILHKFQEVFRNLPYETLWVLFLPLMLSFNIMRWIVGPEQYENSTLVSGYIDPGTLWAISIFIGMFIGVIITYSIHRIQVLTKARKL